MGGREVEVEGEDGDAGDADADAGTMGGQEEDDGVALRALDDFLDAALSYPITSGDRNPSCQ